MKRISMVFVVSAILLAAGPASAGVTFGAAPTVGIPFGARANYTDTAGWGVDAFLGYRLKLAILQITPELAFSYLHVDPNPAAGNPTLQTYRGLAGLRLGLGEIFVPYVYAHVGYGGVTGGYAKHGRLVPATPTPDYVDQGFTMDVGLGFDINIVRILAIGLSAGYNVLWPNDGASKPYQWVNLALQVRVIF